MGAPATGQGLASRDLAKALPSRAGDGLRCLKLVPALPVLDAAAAPAAARVGDMLPMSLAVAVFRS